MVNRFLISAIKMLLGDWEVFKIYKKSIPQKTDNNIEHLEGFSVRVNKLADSRIKIHVIDEAAGNNKEVSSLVAAWGEGYTRKYIHLEPGSAKVMDVFTDEKYRGQGLARLMLTELEKELGEHGVHCLYARIWHSNKSSRRAFEKAGWEVYGTKLGFKFFRLIPFRMGINC